MFEVVYLYWISGVLVCFCSSGGFSVDGSERGNKAEEGDLAASFRADFFSPSLAGRKSAAIALGVSKAKYECLTFSYLGEVSPLTLTVVTVGCNCRIVADGFPVEPSPVSEGGRNLWQIHRLNLSAEVWQLNSGGVGFRCTLSEKIDQTPDTCWREPDLFTWMQYFAETVHMGVVLFVTVLAVMELPEQ